MDDVKVLVVDDNTLLLHAMTDFLQEKERITVVGQATNGVEAVDMVEAYEPDVVVTDIIMPRMDGFMLMETLGRMNLKKHPEIVALTALGRDDFITRAMSLGARYYMVKPFDATALYRCILDAAQIGGTQPLLQETAPAVHTGAGIPTTEERIASIFLAVGIPAHTPMMATLGKSSKCCSNGVMRWRYRLFFCRRPCAASKRKLIWRVMMR